MEYTQARKYAVVLDNGTIPAPDVLGGHRRDTPSPSSQFGVRTSVDDAEPVVRDERQNVVINNITISHARFVEATLTHSCDELWSVGKGECHRHTTTGTSVFPDCYGVFCFRGVSIVVGWSQIVVGRTTMTMPRIDMTTTTVGAVFSGADVFVANATCVVGVFSGLMGCVPDALSRWQTVAVASRSSTIYVLDGATGDVLAFHHYEGTSVALSHALMALPPTSANAASTSSSNHLNRPPIMLPPTMAVERLDYGSATSFDIVDSGTAVCRRRFQNGVVVSPLQVPTAASVYGEYVPERVCANDPPVDLCRWYEYSADRCKMRTFPACTYSLTATTDNRCVVDPDDVADDLGHNRCVEDAGCASGYARTAFGGLTGVCCEPEPCAGTYNPHTSVCLGPPVPPGQTRPKPACAATDGGAGVPPNAALTTSTSQVCPTGFYGAPCAPCSACRAGQRVVAPCGGANTRCGDCPPGTFMDSHAHVFRRCHPGNGCPGVTSTRDGDCTAPTTAVDTAWWGLALPVYGCIVHFAMAYRQSFGSG